MKVSKVILIVVALHVLVIGGIFIFEGCSRSKTSTPEMAGNETLPGQQPEGMLPAASSNDVASIPNPQGPANVSTPGAPTTSADMTAAPVTAARTHIVKKGDSLWKIAKTEGISVSILCRANKLTKTSKLKIGQKLTIPAAKTAAPVAPDTTAAATPPPDIIGAGYTVKPGDSLWKIAKAQGVSVAAIKQINNLTSDSLKIGQKLRIPAASAMKSGDTTATTSSTVWREPGTYTENGQTIHIVDFNESPSTIAKKYGIKIQDLLKANNISDVKKVQYGQHLIIPLPPQKAPASVSSVTTK